MTKDRTPELGANRPWMDASLTVDERARLLDDALTVDERRGLLHAQMPLPLLPSWPVPPDAIPAAGYLPAVARLGVPALFETDASLGVTNPGGVRAGDGATALPSGLALAASWNPELAFRAGATIGDEAAKKGFNVLLAGGVNLARDPRCGRNFEYLGEDPLLAGVMAGESIRGIQSEGVISTAKHFVLNDQETGRHVVNAVIDEAALRASDLLAFEIAIERGEPGAIMTAYNRINGRYACENEALLNGVLKGDWRYPGWVMTDWGALTGLEAANAGVDQQSGEQLDHCVWFDQPLQRALEAGEISADRVSEMSRRILRSMLAAGLFDRPSRRGERIDCDAHADIAQMAAEEGMVLLKNDRALLPLGGGARRVLLVGGQADAGVLSGAGSSQVTAVGGNAATLRVGGEGAMTGWANEIYHPSSPLKALRARMPNAEVRYLTGRYPSEVQALAGQFDVVIVFATQWMCEGFDAPDLSLPNGQDALIAAAAEVNSNVIVVLETGGPVLMPWLDRVGAVLAAWYPGVRGGEAIAAVLTGDVNPSGRLPITFPRSTDHLPRPALPGFGMKWAAPGGRAVDISRAKSFDVEHHEGADVGYRWFARCGHEALFPFGFGLSYTRFEYSDLELLGGENIVARFTVKNIGDRSGIDTPQLYLLARNGEPQKRLLGWARVALGPGEARQVEVPADRRLLADFDVAARRWRIDAGRFEVGVGHSAEDLARKSVVDVREALFLKPAMQG